nr:hypothetical protein [Tanacetum cinerariifolium]
PRKPPSPNRTWNTALPAAQGDAQSWISDLAKQADARSSFNELLDTPIDFSNFIMHRFNVDTLTPDLLAGPTYELMRGSCSSLTELEYHLEEVYKATTDQLDWVNPEGQQYPHNLLQPLPLILDNRGRRVIPFEHFINNDLEYIQGGASTRKYTTSVTKTKATDYGHIKWIEDLVPCEMWIQQPIDYNKHALWGVSHWGRKRKQFYGYAVNRESARDVYSLQDIEDILLFLAPFGGVTNWYQSQGYSEPDADNRTKSDRTKPDRLMMIVTSGGLSQQRTRADKYDHLDATTALQQELLHAQSLQPVDVDGSSSLSTLHFLKFPENNFEVLKLLENSVEVLKILENKLESVKILENKLESLKLQENQPVEGLVPLSIKKLHPKVSSRGC